ncbi:MAG: hypothetical protein IKN04_22005 [Clostridia bacterium]|nr:hypothetical protein [Clostridia bacterium]
MAYNMNQMAMITGLTTRTLRNHLKLGLLKGEKIDGNWSFTDEELDAYVNDQNIKQAIAAKQHAVIYDFLGDSFKKTNRICTIMDFPVSVEEALSIAKFFGEMINQRGSDIEFRYINEKHFARFILAGSEDQVSDFMRAYYER